MPGHITHNTRIGGDGSLSQKSVAVQSYVENGRVILDLQTLGELGRRVSLSAGDARLLIGILEGSIADHERARQ